MKADRLKHSHTDEVKNKAYSALDLRSISESEFQALFEQVYYEHIDSLIRFAYFRLTDRDKAIDAVQDIFSNYFAYLKKVRAEDLQKDQDLNHRAFLFRSLRNAIIDQYRLKKAVSLDSLFDEGYDESSEEDISSDTETSLMYSLVLSKIKLLKPEQQELLYMRYIEDLSVAEIAQAVGVRENTISVQLHRAIDQLKKHVS